MSSSAYTYAGVPNSFASSITSQPPTSSRPASFSREPSGKTCDTVAVPGADAMIAASMKHPTPAPPELGTLDGLAYALFMPDGEPAAGVVVIHGATSAKESHFDFGRLYRESGLAAVCFDNRGHGRYEGPFGPGAVDDALAMCELMRSHAPRVAVRGSSLGGFLAIHTAARDPGLAAAVAMCPAPEDLLLRGLRSGWLDFDCDRDAREPWLEARDMYGAVANLGPGTGR